ncbi:hypothetical protein ACFL4Y_00385 [Gemmatimonadota bacterium]
MSHATTPTAAELERLDRKRNRSLAWFLGTFLFWSIASMLLMFASLTFLSGVGSQFVPLLLIPFGLFPIAIWGFFLARFLWIQGRIRREPRIAATLDDEMVRHAWMRAASYGFWAMLGTLVLVTLYVMLLRVLVITGVTPIAPSLFDAIQAPLSITVGVAVTIGSYLHQRRG